MMFMSPSRLEQLYRAVLDEVAASGYYARVEDVSRYAGCILSHDRTFPRLESLRLCQRKDGTFLMYRHDMVYEVLNPENAPRICANVLVSRAAGISYPDVLRNLLSKDLVRKCPLGVSDYYGVGVAFKMYGWRNAPEPTARKFFDRFNEFYSFQRDDGVPEPKPFETWSTLAAYRDGKIDHEIDGKVTMVLADALRATCEEQGSIFVNVLATSISEIIIKDWKYGPYGEFWPIRFLDTSPTCFIAPDFKLGVYTHLNESSITIFGKPLLDQLGDAIRPLLKVMIRKSSE